MRIKYLMNGILFFEPIHPQSDIVYHRFHRFVLHFL